MQIVPTVLALLTHLSIAASQSDIYDNLNVTWTNDWNFNGDFEGKITICPNQEIRKLFIN